MTDQHSIDAVITWVDGDDPQHKQKLNQYLASIGRQPKSADSTRFRSLGEIDYCVASIIQYASFIHRIFIITDEQTPSLVERYKGTDWEERIVIVDHKTVFRGYESVLPTFNSLSIETVMHRIEGLSDNFIYLNDDFFLMCPVEPEDFFQNNEPVLRGSFKKQAEFRLSKRIRDWLGFSRNPDDPSFKRSQEISAQLEGFKKEFWRIGHVPHPLKRSTVEALFMTNPQLLETNIDYPLRHENQFSPVALANHWQIKCGHAVLKNDFEDLNIKPSRYSPRKLKQILTESPAKFGCIQSLDQANEKQQQVVLDWLDKKISNLT